MWDRKKIIYISDHRAESNLYANIGMWKKEIILGWECWEE